MSVKISQQKKQLSSLMVKREVRAGIIPLLCYFAGATIDKKSETKELYVDFINRLFSLKVELTPSTMKLLDASETERIFLINEFKAKAHTYQIEALSAPLMHLRKLADTVPFFNPVCMVEIVLSMIANVGEYEATTMSDIVNLAKIFDVSESTVVNVIHDTRMNTKCYEHLEDKSSLFTFSPLALEIAKTKGIFDEATKSYKA